MQLHWGNGLTVLILALILLLILWVLIPIENKVRKAKIEYLVAVEGTIEKVLDDDFDTRGGKHQRLIVKITKVLENSKAAPIAPKEEVFVAIRYGDRDGFPERVRALDHAQGKKIEIRGKYIPKDNSSSKEARSVIHFTHKPLGYIRFHNKTYR